MHLIFHDAATVGGFKRLLTILRTLSSGRPFDFTGWNKSRTTGARRPDGDTRNITGRPTFKRPALMRLARDPNDALNNRLDAG